MRLPDILIAKTRFGIISDVKRVTFAILIPGYDNKYTILCLHGRKTRYHKQYLICSFYDMSLMLFLRYVSRVDFFPRVLVFVCNDGVHGRMPDIDVCNQLLYIQCLQHAIIISYHIFLVITAWLKRPRKTTALHVVGFNHCRDSSFHQVYYQFTANHVSGHFISITRKPIKQTVWILPLCR
jgi:hypothetical protein